MNDFADTPETEQRRSNALAKRQNQDRRRQQLIEAGGKAAERAAAPVARAAREAAKRSGQVGGRGAGTAGGAAIGTIAGAPFAGVGAAPGAKLGSQFGGRFGDVSGRVGGEAAGRVVEKGIKEAARRAGEKAAEQGTKLAPNKQKAALEQAQNLSDDKGAVFDVDRAAAKTVKTGTRAVATNPFVVALTIAAMLSFIYFGLMLQTTNAVLDTLT